MPFKTHGLSQLRSFGTTWVGIAYAIHSGMSNKPRLYRKTYTLTVLSATPLQVVTLQDAVAREAILEFLWESSDIAEEEIEGTAACRAACAMMGEDMVEFFGIECDDS